MDSLPNGFQCKYAGLIVSFDRVDRIIIDEVASAVKNGPVH